MRSLLLRALLPALVVLLASCASSHTPDPSPGAQQPAPDDSPWAFFLDTGDGGDDPWTPGCHYKCTDPACEAERVFWGGDSCNGGDLQEWAEGAPHPAGGDIRRHDCDAECTKRGYAAGRCVTLKNACDDVYPSSRCECD